MKKFYSTISGLRFIKSYVLFVSFLCAFNIAKAQVYYVSLSGPNESPANNSAGVGKAIITISGNSMRVQITFSGLTGNTTASHIHAPTATAATGTAGVATTTPTFTDFPLGVKSGTYDHTFDMMASTSYNPSYVTANGGTPASAFATFKASIAAGKAYLNVHSNVFPGGEIRGFLVPCAAITVSIPDAFALSQGVLPNTVYPAYSPAASLTLQASVSGGTTPYVYDWSNGSHSDAITVSPTVTTAYSVAVHDQNGCLGTAASKTVNVMNISGGKKDDKIVICHNGHSQTIATPAVVAHLNHGDMLGTCSDEEQSITVRQGVNGVTEKAFAVRVLSNPSPNYFELQITGKANSVVQLRVYDLLGRVVETKPSLQANQSVRLGHLYSPGIYLVEILQGTQKQTLRLVKN